MTLFQKVQQRLSKRVEQGKVFLSFPHIKVGLCIMALALIMLFLAYVLEQCRVTFWSSICANLFAGFVTGLVLCLVSGFKQRKIMVLQIQIKWLEDIEKMLKVYIEDYHKLRGLKFVRYSEQDDTLFNFIYDVGVHANDVNSTIMQSKFDKTIPFKPYEYCKERFGYDAVGLDQAFYELHENLYLIDIDQPSSKEIIGYFAVVHPELMKLRTEVRSALNELNVRLAVIQRTII